MSKSLSIAVALIVGVGAPAFAQNREHQQMAAELRIMQEQAQQLAITLAALNQAIAESAKSLAARLDEANNTTRKAFADQKLLIDNMASEVSKIRERGDDTNVRIASLREELEALRVTVQALQQLQQYSAAPPPVADPAAPAPATTPGGAPASSATTGPPPVTAPPPPALPSTAGLSPTRLYETAQADYFAGQWNSAVSGFEAFLRAFPRSEQADDAQFYIGETYFAQNQWDQAVAAYNLVIQMYPGTNSIPVAYYKRGLAEQRLGQLEAARASWEAAVKNFPDTDAGRLAKQNLERLQAQPR